LKERILQNNYRGISSGLTSYRLNLNLLLGSLTKDYM